MPESQERFLDPVLSSGTAYKPGLGHYQLIIANAGRLRGK